MIIATERLDFPRAARRVFLENGDEIKDDTQFFKNAPVYVSCGEEFEDPFQQTKKVTDKRSRTLWLSDGIHFPSDEKTTKSVKYPERHMKSVKVTRRLIAMENGQEYDPTSVVLEILNSGNSFEEEEKLELEYFENFLVECTERLKMTSNARIVYNWHGERVVKIDDVPKLDKCIQHLVSKVEYSPLWVSKGEGKQFSLTFIYHGIYET